MYMRTYVYVHMPTECLISPKMSKGISEGIEGFLTNNYIYVW